MFRSTQTLDESRGYGCPTLDGEWEENEDKNSDYSAIDQIDEACIVSEYLIKIKILNKNHCLSID